jgi:hypothetical protein
VIPEAGMVALGNALGVNSTLTKLGLLGTAQNIDRWLPEVWVVSL